MPDFILNEGSSDGVTLENAFGFIGQNGALSTGGEPAIESSGWVDVTILGSLYTSYSEAIYHDEGGFNLIVGSDGFIGNFANHLDGIYVEDATLATITNSGLISTHATAIHFNGFVYSEFADVLGHVVTNTGTIVSSQGSGIYVSTDDVFLSLSNSGEITGFSGVVINGGSYITNSGTITGDAGSAFHSNGDDATDTIKNTGTMIGDIDMGGGDDRLVNRGDIQNADLGDGDDFYNGRRGFVEEDVTGGAGNDTLRGGDGDETFRGNDGDDQIRGRRGDDWLVGGDGEDTLAGQKGDDFLNGGKNADVFVFAANGGFDTISRLNANDTIDLSALGLAKFRQDIKPHIEDAKRGSLIDLSDGFDLMILVRGTDADDLRASDFLL